MKTLTPQRLRRTAAALCSLLAVAALAPSLGYAQSDAAPPDRSNTLPRVSPNASVSQTVGVTEVRLSYGQPGVKGRDIFGELVPYGEVWRTGANEATTISFSDDVEVEGQPLEAGTYGFFTVPGRDAWTLIFNDTAEQWGAYEYDESQDVLRVEVDPQEAPHTHERLAFHVGQTTDTSTTISLVWDDVRVPFQVQTDTEANVRTRAEAAMDGATDWQAPLQYAAYALENDLYPETALGWAERSIEMEEHFQNVALKARLLASMDRYDEARQSAERAMTLAEGMDEAPQGMEQFEEQVAGWPSAGESAGGR